MYNLFRIAICVFIMLFSTAALAQNLPGTDAYVTGEILDSVEIEPDINMLSAPVNIESSEGIEHSGSAASPAGIEKEHSDAIDGSHLSGLAEDETKPEPIFEPQPTLSPADTSGMEQPHHSVPPPQTDGAVMADGHTVTEPKPTAIPNAKPRLRPLRLSSATVLPGGFLSYSVRDGYRKYKDVRELEHINRENMVMYGIFGGKRLPLNNPRLRIQNTLELGWSRESVVDDVYKNVPLIKTDGSIDSADISLHDDLFTVGVQSELHILIPTAGKYSCFLSLGPGFGWSSFKRTAKVGFYPLPWMDDVTGNIGFNFNIGAGMDFTSNERTTLSICYNFRIWRPVSYDNTLLFPMGVDYKEQFFTHMVKAQVLILPKRGMLR